MNAFGRPTSFAPGPDQITTVSGTSTAVPLGAANDFWVVCSARCRVAVTGTASTFTMNNTNSSELAAGLLYGPFQVNRGSPANDKYVHVAGVGGTPTATITLAV